MTGSTGTSTAASGHVPAGGRGRIATPGRRLVLLATIAWPAFAALAAEPAGEKQVLFPKDGATVCRIPSLVATRDGVVLATADRRIGSNHDWGHDTEIVLRRSRDGGKTWLPVQVLASERGVNFHSGPSLVDARTGRVFKFFKKRPASFRRPDDFHAAMATDAERWRRWGVGSYVIHSDDAGRTWSAARTLPEGILGPVRNKPVRIGDRLLCGSSTEHAGWRVHMEWTDDLGRSWKRTAALNSAAEWGLIQPTLLTHPDHKLQILCRSQQGRVVELWSHDRGENWSPPQPLDLPNPNSGIDGLTLTDGRHLLVYNHTSRGRSPLNVALSRDGRNWINRVTLEDEPGEFSYPAVIQASGGSVEIVYTWNRRRIRHVTLNPSLLNEQ